MDAEGGNLVIVGAGETAEIAFEYFTHDSPFEVRAFSAERAYVSADRFCGLPVVPFEDLETHYPPEDHAAFVAVSYNRLNRVRARLYGGTKAKGYRLASYVSSRAFVWRTVEIGENSFVFENNVLQHGVRIGNDVILWSGNHVGHRTAIRDHAYVSSHVVISGFCDIGESCFLGVNSAFNDELQVGRDCLVGSGAVVIRNCEPGKVYVGNPAKALEKSAYETMGVPEGER
jgi:sugar O-acyltransferase (sialic acid O-acetyltransferase NeuD family)